MNTINKNLTFTTKPEYLTYRSKWKIEYYNLSCDIKNLKKETRASYHHITYTEYIKLYKLKEKATNMLLELKEAKILVQEQYQASKLNKV